ncbi:hypothetical protein SAMN04488065_1069 [Haloplanus vescus]|uniref:DUF7322 domain-containing protein n=1 Tax=Haloplanus vescus TaxID=555874 RepID=A0A1H3WT60_9EURY|nr:hypothetical protein [Haloplanus vescus]SDZ89534.1 hypothetical protein SAMN04488065_1069 [Haloplanus vescus]
MLDPFDEPDDTDATPQLGNPEHDLPKTPSVDVDESDADPEVKETFWRSVFLTNVAIFALTVGPMVAYFRGWWTVGAAAAVLGAIMLFRVYQHYRAFERHQDDERNA